MHKTSEIERIRLLDLVKSLQKRIEDLNEKSMESENRLNEQLRRNANLEKQLEKSRIPDPKSGLNFLLPNHLFIFNHLYNFLKIYKQNKKQR